MGTHHEGFSYAQKEVQYTEIQTGIVYR